MCCVLTECFSAPVDCNKVEEQKISIYLGRKSEIDSEQVILLPARSLPTIRYPILKPPTANAEGTEKNENTLTIIPTIATPTLFGQEHAFFDVTTDKPSQNTKWTLAILATLIQESIVDNIG